MRESEKYPVGVLIGGRDCGKTTFMRGNTELGIKGYIREKVEAEKLKGVICVDTMRERKEYLNVKKINHPQEYKSGPVHLIVSSNNADECVQWITDHVKDTLIVFEDARKIVPVNITKTAFESLIIDSKNIHCPVWFIFHTWMNVPKGLYSLMDLIEIFKTKQHPSVRKGDIMNYEEVLEAYDRVRLDENPYSHETVSNGA